MKNKIFLVLLLLIPIVSAVEINLNGNFSQGETLIAKITGVFTQDILQENLVLYRAYHVRIPMEFNIYKVDKNNYYVYAQLGERESGQYSLVLKDIKYSQSGKNIQGDIWTNFTLSSEYVDFYVSPGFVSSKNNFFIEFVNMKETSLEIEKSIVGFNSKKANSSEGSFWDSLFSSSMENSSGEKIILLPGETKSVEFEISDFVNESFIQLKSNNTQYFIPVFVLTSVSDERAGVYFDSSDLDISLSTNSNTSRIIYIKNSGGYDLTNISLNLSGSLKNYANLSVNKIDEIKKDSSTTILINFSSGNSEIKLNGSVDIYAENFSDTLLISLNVIKNYVPPKNISTNTSMNKSSYTKNCSELGGKVCSSTQKCNSTLIDSRDGKCCIKKDCLDISKSNKNKIIGWVIIGLVALFLLWFYIKKYSKTKKQVNILEVSKMLSKMQKDMKK
jgi:hypothetical protein